MTIRSASTRSRPITFPSRRRVRRTRCSRRSATERSRSCSVLRTADRMRVVVIGATGNVGTALLDALAITPEVTSVLGVARRVPEAETGSRVGKTSWHAADISRDPLDFVAGADAVVHLAWLIQPSRDPQVMRATNVDGTARVVR